MTQEVAPCCSPGKAVLVGDTSPSLCFGSFVLLCATTLAASLALHTHVCALVWVQGAVPVLWCCCCVRQRAVVEDLCLHGCSHPL